MIIICEKYVLIYLKLCKYTKTLQSFKKKGKNITRLPLFYIFLASSDVYATPQSLHSLTLQSIEIAWLLLHTLHNANVRRMMQRSEQLHATIQIVSATTIELQPNALFRLLTSCKSC